MRILTREKYFTLYNRAIKDTLLYLEICFLQKRRKILWSINRKKKMYKKNKKKTKDVNHVNPSVVGKDWFDGTPCERYVNCGNPFCNRRILASEENEDKYLRGCSHECRVHPRNRYVSENGLSQEEVVERLAAIGESLDVTPA